MIPGLGFCPSSRGSQSWAVPGHPSCVAPGKRPRLTPNPAMALTRGRWVMPFGGPGGDLQPQAMLQVFLNHTVFGMSVQEAVEAPRFVTHSFPGSFEPHPYHPGRLDLERESGSRGRDARRPAATESSGSPISRSGRPASARSRPTASGACSAAEPTRAGPPAQWAGEAPAGADPIGLRPRQSVSE